MNVTCLPNPTNSRILRNTWLVQHSWLILSFAYMCKLLSTHPISTLNHRIYPGALIQSLLPLDRNVSETAKFISTVRLLFHECLWHTSLNHWSVMWLCGETGLLKSMHHWDSPQTLIEKEPNTGYRPRNFYYFITLWEFKIRNMSNAPRYLFVWCISMLLKEDKRYNWF
jgi:hypothetical protein